VNGKLETRNSKLERNLKPERAEVFSCLRLLSSASLCLCGCSSLAGEKRTAEAPRRREKDEEDEREKQKTKTGSPQRHRGHGERQEKTKTGEDAEGEDKGKRHIEMTEQSAPPFGVVLLFYLMGFLEDVSLRLGDSLFLLAFSHPVFSACLLCVLCVSVVVLL
jgi:hypothetical protein